VNIHITLCEQCQTLHYDPCLKYLLAPTRPTTSGLEGQAAVENIEEQPQARMMPSGSKSIKTTATINPIASPIARIGTLDASRTTTAFATLMAICRIEGRGEFTCFTLISEAKVNSSVARAIFSDGPIAHWPDMIETQPIEKDDPF
jgi:hypothetical protein